MRYQRTVHVTMSGHAALTSHCRPAAGWKKRHVRLDLVLQAIRFQLMQGLV
jgi:hypothetical protein